MRIRQTNSTNRRCRRAALGPSNMHVAQLSGAVHWSLSQHRPCLVAAYPYLEVASGSIPLFLIASEARAEARNSISRLEPSMSPEPATTAAENVWTNWISGARRPAKSTPAACTISLTGMTTRSAPPAATMPVASLPRGVALTLIFSAMPSRGKRSFVSQIPLLLPRSAAVLALSRTGWKSSTVLTAGSGATARPHRHAEGYSRKIHVRSGDDPPSGDQLTEALPGEDHHVNRHAAGELRGNRLRPCSLRRTRSSGDLDAARPLEFRQQLLVRATESAGYQNVQLCRCRHWPKQRGKDDE